MQGYLFHARWISEHGSEPLRSLVFQAWGTPLLLATIMKAFGSNFEIAASILWGAMAATSVPITYLLARRVLPDNLALIAGVGALLWYPNLVNSGFFLSEAPLLCFLMTAVWRFAILIQEGKGAGLCGLLFAICITLRFETSLIIGLSCLLLLATGKHHRRTFVKVLAFPLVAIFAALIVHWHNTGSWGLAESGRANLTPARCHIYLVQAFDSEHALAQGEAPARGHSFGVPSFGMKFHENRINSPLGMFPAFGTDDVRGRLRTRNATDFAFFVTRRGSILKFVGHRADRSIHAAIQDECLRRTGFAGQALVSLTNLSQLWFGNSQWPDNAERGEAFLPWSDGFVRLFQVFILAPSMAGIAAAMRRWRTEPQLALCALPLVSIMLVALVWFGEIRLRSPYDPFAILLATWSYHRVWTWLRRALNTTSSDATHARPRDVDESSAENEPAHSEVDEPER